MSRVTPRISRNRNRKTMLARTAKPFARNLAVSAHLCRLLSLCRCIYAPRAALPLALSFCLRWLVLLGPPPPATCSLELTNETRRVLRCCTQIQYARAVVWKTCMRLKLLEQQRTPVLFGWLTLFQLSMQRATIATQQQRGFKVAVLGAAGGIGQPLSLLLKLNPKVTELSCFDLAPVTPGNLLLPALYILSKKKIGTLEALGYWRLLMLPLSDYS